MRILIIEDERSIARRTERLLREILGARIISLELRDRIEGGKDYLLHHEIDLLFLDLNLNGQNGFEVLRSVIAESFETIIISAYKDKAITAFEYGVVDFVPKPFDRARLEKALQRLEYTPRNVKSVVVKRKGRLKVIPVAEIRYIKGANIYSEIFTTNEEKELSNKTLDQFERLLPSNFARIHKSYIADMRRATEILIHVGSKYELKMDDEIVLPIGRTRYKALKSEFFT